MPVYQSEINNEWVVQVPARIANSFYSFERIIRIHEKLITLHNETVIFDFSGANWFDANLSAVLGAIFINLIENKNKVMIRGMSGAIKNILEKNKFLSTFGLNSTPDVYNTTIDFNIFNKSDRIKFQEYIDSNLLPKITIKMDVHFKSIFASNLEEIYQNARTHGDSSKIITCGQWYPNQKKIKFTICDIGLTIPENTRALQPDLSPSESINWATKYGNSSKPSFESGGLGLYNLKSFIESNRGKMHIISGNGYWGFSNEISLVDLDYHFNGTIVNLEINLNDENMYYSIRGFDIIDNMETDSILKNIFSF